MQTGRPKTDEPRQPFLFRQVFHVGHVVKDISIKKGRGIGHDEILGFSSG